MEKEIVRDMKFDEHTYRGNIIIGIILVVLVMYGCMKLFHIDTVSMNDDSTCYYILRDIKTNECEIVKELTFYNNKHKKVEKHMTHFVKYIATGTDYNFDILLSFNDVYGNDKKLLEKLHSNNSFDSMYHHIRIDVARIVNFCDVTGEYDLMDRVIMIRQGVDRIGDNYGISSIHTYIPYKMDALEKELLRKQVEETLEKGNSIIIEKQKVKKKKIYNIGGTGLDSASLHNALMVEMISNMKYPKIVVNGEEL
tara:strand:- start:25176 stop:25934 length:759 start_codon:yes stop_codon:yes gene_type:complete